MGLTMTVSAPAAGFVVARRLPGMRLVGADDPAPQRQPRTPAIAPQPIDPPTIDLEDPERWDGLA
jgi:hypothetical protein